MSKQPAGWPTITSHPANKPSGQKKKMVDDGLGLKRCELSSHLTVPKRQNQQRKGVQRMKRITCQKGLAYILPYRRRRESAYISYQSLLSTSINRASPEGDNPKCAKEGLAQTFSRGGFQKRHVSPEFCQPQLADYLAALLFPYREVGIKLPTHPFRWQKPGKPENGRAEQLPTRKQSRPVADYVEIKSK